MSPTTLVGNWSHRNALKWPVGLGALQAGGFIGERIRRNKASILLGMASPILEPFALLNRGLPLQPQHIRFVQDTDAYKLLEAACYAWAAEPDDQLLARIESNLDEILARECPAGGLVLPPRSQFDSQVSHELYAAGHFIEMACAHYQATGSERALHAACRWAELFIRERDKGNPYFQTIGTREHPEVELALVRLYRATGERRYLDLAIWIALQSKLVPPVSNIVAGGGSTHAVRVGYLMCGYAEIYLETGDERFLAPLKPLWDELRTTRLYVTGGLGVNEAIPLEPWYLPQTGAIAETCASIALMMFALRAQSLWDDSSCFDVVETIFYNHFLGALNPEQDAIFYYNPLRQTCDLERNAGKSPFKRVKLPDLHGCSCCFPNAWRFLAQLPEYLFASDGSSVTINLYTDAEADISLEDGDLHLSMQSAYPLDEHIYLSVSRPVDLRLRIPSWCDDAECTWAGCRMQPSAGSWLNLRAEPGARVDLRLPMHARALLADARIDANRGQIAYRYGPLVYCYEVAAGTTEHAVNNVRARIGSLPQVTRVNAVPWLKAELVDYASLPAPYFPYESSLARPFTALLPPFYLHANQEQDTHWTTWLPLI